MSQPRFAPITASLLARKGNAAPSAMTEFAPPPPVMHEAPSMPEKIAAPPHLHEVPHAAHDPQHKKLYVSLSHPEHERLAIAAVKTGLTRHQLIRDALDFYFEQLLRDMGEDCRCVAGRSCNKSC
jgi:hypothetical protein